MATEQAVSSPPIAQQAVRREAMAVLAASDTEELDALLAAAGELPAYRQLRKPESGLLMLLGRISGDGAPFNVGEVTVTRAAVRLASSETGFGYVLGRDHDKARLIALCDALIQTERYRSVIESRVIEPIRARQSAARKLAAQRTAATRVEFFTLVRGEDTAA
jgi:alpha-D-ribose 1-methylphosphonate 5-triphosphate synthase subunit PhnG